MGIPQDADLVFDVRFLPNPYYIDTLREKTGNEAEVQDYVMQNDKGRIFLDKLKDMMEFLIPNYILEGKNQLVIAIGVPRKAQISYTGECTLPASGSGRKLGGAYRTS